MDGLQEIIALGPNISDHRFDGLDLFRAKFAGLIFSGCEFSNCVFDEAAISDCAFVRCRFVRCQFAEAAIANTRFAEAEEGTGCTWSFCSLTETRFADCNLSLNKIANGTAHLAAFKGCSGMGLVFEADVHKQISKRLIVGGVKFVDCRLQYAVFQGRDLSNSVFQRCDLRDASFRKADLTNASLSGSALANVDFASAVLDGASIAGATFEELKLHEMRSYAGLIVSQDQASIILNSLGIVVVR